MWGPLLTIVANIEAATLSPHRWSQYAFMRLYMRNTRHSRTLTLPTDFVVLVAFLSGCDTNLRVAQRDAYATAHVLRSLLLAFGVDECCAEATRAATQLHRLCVHAANTQRDINDLARIAWHGHLRDEDECDEDLDATLPQPHGRCLGRLLSASVLPLTQQSVDVTCHETMQRLRTNGSSTPLEERVLAHVQRVAQTAWTRNAVRPRPALNNVIHTG